MIPKRRSVARKDMKRISPDERFRLMVESSFAGAYFIQDGLFQYVNPAFCRMFGYETDEIMGKLGPMDLTAPEDWELVARNIQGRIEGNVPEIRYAFHGIRKDRTKIFVEVHGSAVKYKKRPAIIGTIIDNTALKESEEKYRRFFSDDIAARYITAADGTLLDCNAAFVKLFDFSSLEEAMGTNVASFYLNPHGRDRFIDLIKERKRLERLETEYVRKGGIKMYVIENAIGEFDSDGNLTSVQGYLIDETNQRKLEAQLFEAQKMESIGTLVSGIAHDLNNVLAIILGRIHLMDPQKASLEKMARSREAISKAVNRGAHTIKQLLTFAHKVEIITESVKVNDIIEEVLEFLKETFPERISFKVELESNLPSINADPNQLQQVFINLSVNARDAMPQGGTITISTSRVSGKTLNGRFPEIEPAEYILIKVADTGTGMDEKTKSRIFEPFFTTKKVGSGLGLSVVYGIVHAHHGFIDLESSAGQGTVFFLYLPIPPQTIEAPPPIPERILEARGHGETILVVEDDEPVLEYMKEMLEDNGYRILLAKDGFEAVRVFGEHRGEISLVIMDMGLPRMSGAHVISELKMMMPDVRIIFMSGYIEPEVKAEIFEAGIKEFLPKPFSAEELLEKVQRVLTS